MKTDLPLRPFARLSVLAVVALVFSSGILTAQDRAVAATAADATTTLLVPPLTARVGERIDMLLVVENASNLAGFQGTIRFDAQHVRALGARLEKDLARSGRDLLQLGPVWRAGAVVLGAATCAVPRCSDTRTWQPLRSTLGVNGSVRLATLQFYAELPGRYELVLDEVQLVDPQGNLLVTATASAVLQVTER